MPLKKMAFGIVIFVAALALLEVGLRVFNYGGDYSLIAEEEVDDDIICRINKNWSSRFFLKSKIEPPFHGEQSFTKKKGKHIYRIFCLGGGETYGVPYPPNVNFPILLRQRLTSLFPEETIEVINFGMPAINSFVLLEFAKELTNYEPDLFIVYPPQSEFYGPFGSISTERLFESRSAIKAHLFWDRYRVYRLAFNLALALASEKPSELEQKFVLADNLVAIEQSSLGDEMHNFAIDNYIENVLELIELARSKGVDLIFGTPTCNLKDQQPFATALMPGAKEETWRNYLDQAGDHLSRGNNVKAKFAMDRAYDYYHESARSKYVVGRAYLEVEENEKSRALLSEARDLDMLPLRLRGEFERALQRICVEKNVTLAPIDKALGDNSRGGVPGNEVFMDHANPNFLGHFVMAKQFAIAMYDNNCIVPKERWPVGKTSPDSVYWKKASVTPLDRKIAEINSKIRVRSWPFNTVRLSDAEVLPALESPVDSLALGYIVGEIEWVSAHRKMAAILREHGQRDLAEIEERAIKNVFQ